MKKLSLIILALIIGLALSANLMADDYYVDPLGTDDVDHGGGAGTGAWKTIEYAVNTVADPTTATIVIYVSGDTYTLGNDYIGINRGFTALTIDGAGAGSTIVQAQASAYGSGIVFYINTGETVTIRDMTIQNGSQGIYNFSSTLTIINCAISYNGTPSYGGGVRNQSTGTLTATNCTINGNKALNGGGIYNDTGCSVTLTNCTIFDNQTTTQEGGGIENLGTMTLTNCTITGNSSPNSSYGGGVVNWYANAINIINTVIADNTDSDSNDDFYNNNSTVNDNGYNIVEFSNYAFSATGDITGDQVSLNLSSTLAGNNTLNGTQTLKTTSGSVAINAGTSVQGSHPVEIPSTDQRGANRNGATDIGAYEYYYDDGSLPVELTSFTAENRSGGVLLKWTTESEIENLGFLIEKQILDTGCWMEIAGYLTNTALEGHGSTTERHDYQFIDKAVQPGVTYEYRLGDVDYNGKVTWHRKVEIKVKIEGAKIPTEFGLQRAYPNPFNPTTTISYQLASASLVKISIYDVRGKLVETLVNGQKDRGNYSIVWDAGGLSSGIYFYKIAAGEYNKVNKCLLIR